MIDEEEHRGICSVAPRLLPNPQLVNRVFFQPRSVKHAWETTCAPNRFDEVLSTLEYLGWRPVVSQEASEKHAREVMIGVERQSLSAESDRLVGFALHNMELVRSSEEVIRSIHRSLSNGRPPHDPLSGST